MWKYDYLIMNWYRLLVILPFHKISRRTMREDSDDLVETEGNDIVVLTRRYPNIFNALFGISCLAALIPITYLAVEELSFLSDLLEYGGDSSDIVQSVGYSLTTFLTILIVGMLFLGSLDRKRMRVVSGILLIILSGASTLSRFQEWSSERREMQDVYDYRESWVDFLSAPDNHMAIEFNLLVLIIGMMIIRR